MLMCRISNSSLKSTGKVADLTSTIDTDSVGNTDGGLSNILLLVAILTRKFNTFLLVYLNLLSRCRKIENSGH